MFDRLAELREKRENGEGGFTLIELLVVVVIIGILIAIAIPLYLNYRRGAADKSAQSDVRGAISSLEQCNSDNNSYPAGAAANGQTATAVTAGNGIGACALKMSISDNTTMSYYATTGTPSSYVIVASNSGGTSGKFYCYNSANGGSVKSATSNVYSAC